MGRPVSLAPDPNFPQEAIAQSTQVFPKTEGEGGNAVFTWNVASAADQISPWGRNVYQRDRQLRDFWPTETYLAGAMANVAMRNAVFQWEIRGGSDKVNQAITDILTGAIAGDSFGWVPFAQKYSQDLYTQDNGAFIELIRDPGMDANSRFKGPLAPVLGVGHLDSNRCTRTGNPKFPIVYMDRNSVKHKLQWYEVIPFSDYPSAIETMNGVGYCAVTRVLRMAQVVRSISIYKDEKISGRQFKQIHFVSGVSRQDIKDEMVRGQEEANNTGMIRFILPSILASLDPEKPVSTATLDLASLPDGFDYDQEMKWYISSLALGFGVDYQEFAPLPGGNMGSSQQSMILHRKGTGKGPAVLMRMLSEAFRNYGLLPKGVEMRFNDKDEQEELERQTVRTKALEEYALAIRNFVLTPEAARKDLIERGIYTVKTIAGIPDDYGIKEMDPNQKQEEVNKNNVGQTGGNTMAEDAMRTDKGKQNETGGDRLRKAIGSLFVRKETVKQATPKTEEVKRKVVVNMPAALTPIVNLLIPKQTGEFQSIERDAKGNMVKVTAEKKYAGFIKSSNTDTLTDSAVKGGVTELEDGTTVVQAPTQARQNITIKMPKVKSETKMVVHDAQGNIEYVTSKIEYEDQ